MKYQNETKMKHYNHITTLEIDEVETVVSIDFESDGFSVEIQKITDLDSGDAIAPDLTGQITEIAETALYNELMQFSTDFEADKESRRRFSYAL